MKTNKSNKVAILVPTLNAGTLWNEFLKSVDEQYFKADRKIILDSGSTDDTVGLAKKHGFEVITIKKDDFDHGYARQLLAQEVSEIDILLYLTQDCLLANRESVKNLVEAFNYEDIGIAYGRQLPHKDAKILESHARLFNYNTQSVVKSLADKTKMGIKTASCSNSFAAYRRTALEEVGGFPQRSIFGEDVIVGGHLLQKGWKIAYVANSQVYHSHNYSIKEEFKRYFDIGVFHKTNDWLLKEFGSANGEGLKFIKSELYFIVKNNIFVLPKMFGSTLAKWLGYKLGLNYDKLSHNLIMSFSMHKSYWNKQVK